MSRRHTVQLLVRHPTVHFLIRRLAWAFAILALVSFLTFALMALAPGDPVSILLAGRLRTPELVQSLEEMYNLTGPLPVRYANWAADALRFDFGESITYGQPVTAMIRSRAPLTVQMAALAVGPVVLFGVPLGVLAAVKRGKLFDRATVSFTVLGVSVPAFITGILFIYVFSLALGWFPTFGAGTAGLDRLTHLVLPAGALALSMLAIIVKITRSSMITELDQDYVVFARARGYSRTTVVMRHAFRNALIPIVTTSALLFAFAIGGAVLIEQVFALPGLGTLLVEAAELRDLPMLQGLVLMTGVVIIMANLLIDLTYAVIDPRVRYRHQVE